MSVAVLITAFDERSAATEHEEVFFLPNSLHFFGWSHIYAVFVAIFNLRYDVMRTHEFIATRSVAPKQSVTGITAASLPDSLDFAAQSF